MDKTSQGFSGIETNLIECNRNTSLIDKTAPESQNGRWTTKCNFQLKRGDKVSVEAVMIDAGQSSANQTIELDGNNIPGTNYCDQMALISFGFFVNNNNINSTLMPVFNLWKYPNSFSQAAIDLGQVINGTSQWCNSAIPINPNNYPPESQTGPGQMCGFAHSPTYGTDRPGSYQTWGYADDTFSFNPSLTTGTTCANLKYIIIEAVGQSSYSNADLKITPYFPAVEPLTNCRTAFVPGTGNPIPIIDPAINGWDLAGANFEICHGMGVDIRFSGSKPGLPAGSMNQYAVGIVAGIWAAADPSSPFASSPVIGVGSSMASYGVLVIELRDTYDTTPMTSVPNNDGSVAASVIGYTRYGGWSTQLATAGFSPGSIADICQQPATSRAWDRKAKGQLGMGQLNASSVVKKATDRANFTGGPIHLPEDISYVPPVPPALSGSMIVRPYILETHAGGNPYNGGGTQPGPPNYDYTYKGTMLRKLGGAYTWDRARARSNAFLTSTIGNTAAGNLIVPQECSEFNMTAVNGGYPGPFPDANDPAVPQTPVTSIKSLNYMMQQSNTPYIMVCPSFEGTQYQPGGNGPSPDLQPMTAFVWINIKENFVDVNALASLITKQFHAVDPMTRLASNGQTEDPILNNVTSLYSNGYFPLNQALTEIALSSAANIAKNGDNLYSNFTGANPIWNGPLVKCIPANMTTGTNWKYQKAGPYFNSPNDQKDYLKTGGGDPHDSTTRGSASWCNTIYGNMAYKDFTKAYVGDRVLKHSDTWTTNGSEGPNTPQGGCVVEYGDCPRPIILNTQLRSAFFQVADPQNTAMSQKTAADPGGIPYLFNGAIVDKYDCIMTNMYYTQENIDLLTLMKKNEYYDVEAEDASDDETIRQQQSWNWFYSVDLGQSQDDHCPFDYEGIEQQNLYKTPDPTTGDTSIYTTTPFYLLRTLCGQWCRNPPQYALADPYPAAQDLQAKYWQVPPGDSQRKSWCSPAQNTLGNGFERGYQYAKRTGIMKVHSRWIPEFDSNANVPNFTLEAGRGASGPYSDPPFNGAKNADGKWLNDPTMSKEANIGAVPYSYFYLDSVTGTILEKKFICFSCFKDYHPKDNDIKTWELERFSYGDVFFWSPSMYDNGVIIPMNGDYINQSNKLYFDNAGTDVTLNPDSSYKNNNQNSIFVGCVNASMIFNNSNNRFELGGLYTATNLSKTNEPLVPATPPATGMVPIAGTPQIGEFEIVINKTQTTAVHDIYQNLVGYGSGGTAVGDTAPRKGPGNPWAYNHGGSPRKGWKTENSGILDAQSGVFINAIYLPPSGWTPPQGISLSNFYDPTIKSVPDPTVNMAAAGQPPIAGTKYINQTEVNRNKILEGLTLASEDNWNGCLFDKMGFAYNDLIPKYGRQENRFNEFNFGSTEIKTMYQGSTMAASNTQADCAADIDLGVIVTPPDKGTPVYNLGFLNNEAIGVGGLPRGSVAASRIPSLFTVPYYEVYSSICETNFQDGANRQNCIAIALKNYNQAQYYFIYATDYSTMIQLPRTITEITTEIINPNTGNLAKLNPGSSIIYKIQRNMWIDDPDVDVDGDLLNQPKQKVQGSEHIPAMSELLNYEPEELKGEQSYATLENIVSTRIRELNYINEPVAESATVPEGQKAAIMSAETHAEIQLLQKAHAQIQSIAEKSLDFKQGPRYENQFPEHWIVDREKLMKGIYKLVIEKALEQIPVIADKHSLLDPGLITAGINSVLGQIGEEVSHMDAEGSSDITSKRILKRLRAKGVLLGRYGQIVKRKRKSAEQQDGQYTFNKKIMSEVVYSLEHGENFLHTIQKAIDNKDIGYKPVASKESRAHLDTSFIHTTKELYAERGVMGLIPLIDRAAERESLEGRGKKQEAIEVSRKEAFEIIKEERESGNPVSMEQEKEILEREKKAAIKDPELYMQRIGSYDDRDDKPGDQKKKFDKLENDQRTESRRGDMVVKE